MTLAELDRLERETNKDKSKNLKGIVTPAEKIIVCLGETRKANILKLNYSMNYFILTDYRIVDEFAGFTNIMLDKIATVELKSFIGSELYVGIPQNSTEIVSNITYANNGIRFHRVVPTITDKAYIKWLADELNKYISESKIRLRSNTTPNNDNDIAGQLEKLTFLYQSGSITQAEYKKAKDKLLS